MMSPSLHLTFGSRRQLGAKPRQAIHFSNQPTHCLDICCLEMSRYSSGLERPVYLVEDHAASVHNQRRTHGKYVRGQTCECALNYFAQMVGAASSPDATAQLYMHRIHGINRHQQPKPA